MVLPDIIGHVLGEWGPWQLRTVLIIFLCKIPAAWFMACLIFTAPEPRYGEFSCAPPPPQKITEHKYSDLIQLAHPTNVTRDSELAPSLDVCYVYQDSEERWKNVTEEGEAFVEYSERILVPCEHFVHTGEIRSIITDFDLVCSRTILVALTQTFHLLGVLIGGIIANQMLYSISPRRVMLVGMITQIICGNITGFVPTYWFHAAFR